MDLKTIHSKTGKGVTQITQRTAPLSKDLMKVLKLVDGKSTLEQTAKAADLPVPTTEKALQQLVKEGFIRIFETKKEDSGFSSAFGDEEDDFDFTKPVKAAVAPSAATPAAARDDAAALAAAREKAQADARARAEREAQIRARLEVEAKAKAEAERRAIEEARRMQEAAERAKRELEARMAEEAARKKANEESHAKMTAEQQAREAEAAKALAAARAKAESEAKALADARAKAEEEAKALAAARAQAETAARRQAEEAAIAQRDLRAQLKEEIEARIREEMEAKLRVEIEDSARAELEEAVMADAREEARAELERRLAEEANALHRAETEAKRKAEEDTKRMLAEQEVKLRAEMEERIKAETERLQRAALEARARAEREAIERQELEDRLRREAEARRKAEEDVAAQRENEARNRARLEARAREEAEQRARLEAEMKERLEAEQRAKLEAEARAKVEAELHARAQADVEARLEAETHAREEAEKKARMEAQAREIAIKAAAEQAEQKARIEAEVEGRIDAERKAREKAEKKARAREEEEEEERQRQVEHLKLLQAQADERARKEQEALESGGASRHQRVKLKGPTPWGTYIGIALVVLIGGFIGIIHVIPLGSVQSKIQRGLAGWLHDDVSISGVNFALFPSPRLKLGAVTVGKARDATAGSGVIQIPIGALFDQNVRIETLELQAVTISEDAAARIGLWGKNEDRPANVSIDRVVLRNVKVESQQLVLNEFNANFRFERGALKSASLQAIDNKWGLDIKPEADGWTVEATVRGMPLPIGAPIPIDDVKAKGTIQGTQLIFPEIAGTAYFGSFTGSLKADWASGINVNAEISTKDVSLAPLFETFTKDVAISGRMEGAFSITASSPTLGGLLKAPNIVGNYTVKEGSVSNVDLVQAMRTEGGGRGGATKFAELAGGLAVSGGEVRYNKLRLQGGVILANGEVVVGASDQLGGRIGVELRSSVAQDRGSFGISGTVQKPTLKRGA
ncbi:MAG: hypothetical protein SF172_01235 [Burkholderiales bacterium]|nr:hypothetical protein [Burkholderiales bacterium]